MKLVAEPLPGIKIFTPFVFQDSRGSFVKSFHEGEYEKHGIYFTVREEFFSVSLLGVLRGMHFQVPPHDHQKLIYCIAGRVLDVVVDIRRDSPNYGKSAGFELSAENRKIVYIPSGFAHGFLSLEANSCLVYKTDSVHAPTHDAGVLWNSFGFEWPVNQVKGLIKVSPRDEAHPLLQNFSSPF